MGRAVLRPTAARPAGPLAESRSAGELGFWIDAVGAPLLVVDDEHLIVQRLNPAAERFFGVEGRLPMPCGIDELVGPEAADTLSRIWSVTPVGELGDPVTVRCEVAGQPRSLLIHVTPIVVEGRPLRLFTFTDAPPPGSVALATWQDEIMGLLNWLPFGLEIASTDDQVQFVNAHFHEMFGFSQHELVDVENWWRLAYPDPQYREHARHLWATSVAEARAANREMTPFELVVAAKDGTQKIIQFRNRTIGSLNVNLYLDVTKERMRSQELRRLADTDALTGIMNRRHFLEEAHRSFELSVFQGTDLAMLLVDLDHFKRINDAFGHKVGDHVLQAFTARCNGALRRDDLFARIGGEEFVALLPLAGAEEAREIAERIRAAVANLAFDIDGRGIEASASIGIALRQGDDTSVEAMMIRADTALYAAKNAGRNRVVMIT